MKVAWPSLQELERIAAELENGSAEDIITWAYETYGRQLAIGSSFGGPTTMVIVHMAARLAPGAAVYYLNTGLLFDETLALVDTVRERYGIDPIELTPDLTVDEQNEAVGPNLWERDPDLCCAARKIAPQKAFLEHYGAWVTGLRRDQAATRTSVPVVEWDDQFGVGKINPLARWSESAVWSYIERNDVPHNALHAEGYPSIGCRPCTRAIAPGESRRAGRWANSSKVECGLHPVRTQTIDH